MSADTCTANVAASSQDGFSSALHAYMAKGCGSGDGSVPFLTITLDTYSEASLYLPGQEDAGNSTVEYYLLTLSSLTISNSGPLTVATVNGTGSLGLSPDGTGGLSHIANPMRVGPGLVLESLANLRTFEATTVLQLGSLRIKDVPVLTRLDFAAPADMARSSAQIVLSDGCPTCNLYLENTGLRSYGSPLVVGIGSVTVVNNPDLTNITVPLAANITGAINMTTVTTAAIAFPDAKYIHSASVVGAQSLEFPKLVTVDNSLAYNGSLAKLDLRNLTSVALDIMLGTQASSGTVNMSALTTVGRNLYIQDSRSLAGINVDKLNSVGGDLVISGDKMDVGTAFSALTSVNGSLRISGATSSLSLPSLRHVGGEVQLLSSNPSVNCSGLQSLADAGVISNTFTCRYSGASNNSSPSSSPNTSNPPSSPATTTATRSNSAIIGGAVGGVAGVLIICGLFLLLARRRNWLWWRSPPPPPPVESKYYGRTELENNPRPPAEASSESYIREMDGGESKFVSDNAWKELPDNHVVKIELPAGGEHDVSSELPGASISPVELPTGPSIAR